MIFTCIESYYTIVKIISSVHFILFIRIFLRLEEIGPIPIHPPSRYILHYCLREFQGVYEYFITFTDDYSRFGYVYLMRHKSDAFDMFKAFKAEVENQLEIGRASCRERV